MRPALQVQLWARQAPRWHVATAAAALCVALIGISVSFVPRGHSAATQAVALGEARLPSGPASTTTLPGAAPAGGGPAAATGGAAGGLTGAAAATSATTAPKAALTATDRGVTADSIKIGVLPLTLAGLEQTPFYEGFRQDSDKYVAALADYQNAHGGIYGRKVTTVVRKTDPVTRDDQIQACTFMTRDQGVFAVIDPTSSVLYADARQCFTHQNATPFVHGYAESYAVQAQVPGYDVALFPVYDRVAEDWAAAAKATGVLKPGMKVGLVGDRCQPANETAHRVLEPALRRAGAGDVVFGEHDCTLDGLTQVPNIVTQFKLAGVQLVLPFGNAGTQQVFQQAAKNQQYKPTYFESDWYNNACDCQTRTYDADQFDGTKGVTVNYNSDGAGVPELKKCSQIATDAGLPPLTRASADAELVATCDAFFIFVRAADAAGPNLTRAGWARAVQTIGQFDGALVSHYSYAKGKFDGADRFRYVEWHRQCGCYQPISGYLPSVTMR